MSDLDPRLRSRYTRDIDMLLKAVAEEKGELPTRATVQVKTATLDHRVIGWDLDSWLGGRGDTSTPTADRPVLPAATPTATAAPAVEPDRPASPDRGSDSLDPVSVEGSLENRSFMHFLSS